VGFGRPETEGFATATIDTSLLLAYLEANTSGNSTGVELFCTPQSAACVVAYVELANIGRDYSHLVNTALKADPASCWSEMEKISGTLDRFSSRWLWARKIN